MLKTKKMFRISKRFIRLLTIIYNLLCCVGAKSEFGEITTFSEPQEFRLSKLYVVSISNE